MNRPANRLSTATAFVSLLALVACDTANTRPNRPDPTPTPTPTSGFSNETYAQALRSATIKLVGTLPSVEDTQAVLAEGESAYNARIDAMLDQSVNTNLGPQLRGFYRSMFLMGGTVGPVNYDLVPNLAAHLVLEGKPVTELVTADYCIGDNFQPLDETVPANAALCQGEPDPARRGGLISQRPFLKKFGQADTVNMRRVSVVHQLFACGIYPETTDGQMLARTNDTTHEPDDNTDAAMGDLNWPVNTNDTPDDPADDYADPSLGSFENDPATPLRLSKKYQGKLKGDAGAECVQCHGHLNQRRPVFTVYDIEGIYDGTRTMSQVEVPEVNGDQDYCGTLGDPAVFIDPNASDCVDPDDAGPLLPGQKATYFGRDILSPRDLGNAIIDPNVTGGRFYSCMANRHYNFALGKSQGELSMQAAGGSGPSGMAPEILGKYLTVYESSGWNTKELFRAVFKGPEFLAAQQ